MTSKRVSAPADLMSEFDDDDAAAQIDRSTGGKPIQTAFKQPTFTPTQTLVQPTSAPKKSAPPQKTIRPALLANVAATKTSFISYSRQALQANKLFRLAAARRSLCAHGPRVDQSLNGPSDPISHAWIFA